MQFFKLSGAGNDFIALVEPAADPTAEQIKAWCRRGLSLGADGVLVLRREARATRLAHWNADGSPSDLCLNGSRCAVALACELRWDEDGPVRLLTGAGPLECRILGPDGVDMTLPFTIASPRPMSLATPTGAVEASYLEVGVPHLVVEVEGEVAAVDLASLGPPLRHHAQLAPQGANVNFVRRRSRHDLDLRTFERGVEGETLACGTGAVAAAKVAVHAGQMDYPVKVATAGGFDLLVSENEGRPTLAGDARIVARGELWPGSER